MNKTIRDYMSKQGRKGGQVKSEAKAKASAANGAKGGRPPKRTFEVRAEDQDGQGPSHTVPSEGEAEALACEWADKYPERNIFVRVNDRTVNNGSSAYYNRDGYGPVGKAW